MPRPALFLSSIALFIGTILFARLLLVPRARPSMAPATAVIPASATEERRTPIAPVVAPVSAAIPAATTAPTVATEGFSEDPIARRERAAEELRVALVNIICLAPSQSIFHSISASGMFVGSKGYVLTSAHVAEYFLLEDKGLYCVVRAGNPAQAAYRVKLAYLPKQWVDESGGVIAEQAPSGTGEHDFALLAVAGSATPAALPLAFPSVALAYTSAPVDTPVVVGSYGAQELSFAQIESALSPTIVASSVKKLFTFGTNTADTLDLGGSAAAQEGSSGGGVLDLDGQLIGSITTSTVTGKAATRSLSAVSATYIRREYRTETGTGLDTLLATEPSVAIAAFARQTPALEAEVLAAVDR